MVTGTRKLKYKLEKIKREKRRLPFQFSSVYQSRQVIVFQVTVITLTYLQHLPDRERKLGLQ